MSRVPAASLSEVVTMSNATRTVRLVRGVAAMGRGLQLPGRASTNSALAYAFEIELDTCWKCLAMPSNVQNQILSCDANHGARPRRSEHAGDGRAKHLGRAPAHGCKPRRLAEALRARM